MMMRMEDSVALQRLLSLAEAVQRYLLLHLFTTIWSCMAAGRTLRLSWLLGRSLGCLKWSGYPNLASIEILAARQVNSVASGEHVRP